ncbi:MAG TPA: peptidylprolyl isomerase [Elusimicrobiota bacterium]|nr:peptidylprolyl isomerase [Elusimicrobiota bacterium]
MIEPKKIAAVFSFFAAASVALCACQSPSAPVQPTQASTPAPQAQAAAPASSAQNPALTTPSLADAQAPQTFRARFSTTKGDFVVEVHRDWAPQGADRFYNLVKIGYFNGAAFFRVVEGFMVQFGISGTPAVNAAWHEAVIPDDPAVGHSNSAGMITFATAGPNTRTTQVFINYGNNSFLDSQGFTPFGQIVEGMNVVESLYAGYGDGPPSGNGPDQGRLQSEGNPYLRSNFPNLDYVKTAAIEP